MFWGNNILGQRTNIKERIVAVMGENCFSGRHSSDVHPSQAALSSASAEVSL